jgi:hypothetical protein
MESVINLFLYITRCHCLEVAKATLHSFTAECQLLRLKQEKILINSLKCLSWLRITVYLVEKYDLSNTIQNITYHQ